MDQSNDTTQPLQPIIKVDQSNNSSQTQQPMKNDNLDVRTSKQNTDQSSDTKQIQQPIKTVETSHRSSKRQARTNRSLAMMLLLLNSNFFISQTPLAVLLVYLPYEEDVVNKFACTDIVQYMVGAERLYFWKAVAHNFAYMNASVNFILYVISGTEFRKEFMYLIKCASKKNNFNSRNKISDQHS
ncbi:hypothetical protein ACF0H5_024566 [Mactra antiquata]